jgi:hypothetical protein
MADIIRLTEHVVSTVSTTIQPLWCALDVSAYRSVDLFVIASNYGAGVTLNILTYPTLENTTWTTVASSTVNSNNSRFTITLSNSPLTTTNPYSRWIRWSVSATGMRFYIEGVGHRY